MYMQLLSESQIHEISRFITEEIDPFLSIPLSQKMDSSIEEYARKIVKKANGFVLKDKERIVGLVAAYIDNRVEPNSAFLTIFGVDHNDRNKGIGTALLLRIAEELPSGVSLYTTVDVMNETAWGVYRKVGYIEKYVKNGRRYIEMDLLNNSTFRDKSSMLYQKLYFKTVDYFEEINLWKKQAPNAKLYIWGTGSVAAGVANQLEKRNILVNGCFVNIKQYNIDSRLKDKGLKIYDMEDIINDETDVGVIIGHSHYELMFLLERYPAIKKIWAFTDIVRSDIEMNEKFVRENMQQFQSVYDLLFDRISKETLVCFLNAKLTRNSSWVLKDFKASTTYFENDIIALSNKEIYLDVGAYDGESIENFLSAIEKKECLNYHVIATEVQSLLYNKLRTKYADNYRIQIRNYGISDHCGKDKFVFDDQSTCLSNNDFGIEEDVITIDELCKSSEISIIKICIGGSILPILSGAKETIVRDMPKLIISAGLDTRALIDYIPYINSITNGKIYNFYLRFTNAMTEALVLYAIPKCMKRSMSCYEQEVLS